jgi:molybdenum cofactor guanylyltransferase
MKIAGCILAGGRSSRFGSDKALAIMGGKRLLDHAIKRLSPQVADIAINTNSTDAAFAQTGLPLIVDATPDFRGPLAGISAALTWARSVKADALVTVAVDTPLFPVDLAARLSGGVTKIAVAESASGLHPTCGLWPVVAETALSDWLAAGKSLRVTDFLDVQSFEKIWFDAETGLDPFFNVNFEGDAAMAEAQMRDGLDGKS